MDKDKSRDYYLRDICLIPILRKYFRFFNLYGMQLGILPLKFYIQETYLKKHTF